MPFDLVLLPLLGGFWFTRQCYHTKFKLIQASRIEMLFYSATAAVCLAVVARLATFAIGDIAPGLTVYVQKLLPWEYSATALLSFALGPITGIAWNFWFRANEKIIATRAIRKWGDELEHALNDAALRRKALTIWMKDGRVFCALILSAPSNLEQRSDWAAILPILYGHSDPTRFKVQATKVRFDEVKERASDFRRLIKVSEIESVTPFKSSEWENVAPPESY